jgi:hypothetical protein
VQAFTEKDVVGSYFFAEEEIQTPLPRKQFPAKVQKDIRN